MNKKETKNNNLFARVMGLFSGVAFTIGLNIKYSDIDLLSTVIGGIVAGIVVYMLVKIGWGGGGDYPTY